MLIMWFEYPNKEGKNIFLLQKPTCAYKQVYNKTASKRKEQTN